MNTKIMNARKRSLAIVMLPLLLAGMGCASLEAPAKQPEQEQVYLSTLPDGSIRFDTEDERIARLWSAAEQARIEDNNDQALELLYQALEISPQNSLLWSRAAEVQLENSESAMAENFASKSNLFAGANAPLLHRNWLIIEHARSQRGDLLGVRSAHKKVKEYQYLR